MKKRWIAAAMVGALVIGGSAATILANNDGYEVYKEGLKNTHTLQSAQVTMDGKIIDNGTILQTVEIETSYNLAENLLQGVSQINDEQINFYFQDNQMLFKNQMKEPFYVIQHPYSEAKKEEIFKKHHQPEVMKIAEEILDMITFPLHDKFILSEVNGERKIHVQLTNKDLPNVLNLIGEYMIKKSTKAHAGVTLNAEKYPMLSENITMNIPALADNIQINNIELNATLTKENIMKEQTMLAVISGLDKHGKYHELEFQFNINYSHINNVQLSPFTVDEEKLEVVDTSAIGGSFHHF